MNVLFNRRLVFTRRSHSALIKFGVFLSLIGGFIMFIGSGGNLRLGESKVPASTYQWLTISLSLLLPAAVLCFGRVRTIIDNQTRQARRKVSVILPVYRRSYALDSFTAVCLKVEARWGVENPNPVTYKLILEGPGTCLTLKTYESQEEADRHATQIAEYAKLDCLVRYVGDVGRDT